MAVLDDAQQLATENVVYLTRRFSQEVAIPPSLEVYRGRLRQASDGQWVFSAYTGQSGVVGLVLGHLDSRWSSGQGASGATVVSIRSQIYNPPVDPMQPIVPPLLEVIELSEAIPPVFAE